MMPIELEARPGAVAIRSGNWKLLPLGTICAVFAVGGCYMIVSGPTGIRVIGLLNVVAFGLGLARFSFLLLRRKPALVIDESGIFDDGSAVGAGFIPWSEIEAIYVPKFTSQAFMRVFVKNIDEIFSRLSSWKVRLMRMNRSLTGSAINVPVGLLHITREELIASMRAKHPDIFIIPDDGEP
jgi:hypothetical protein